MKVAFLRIYRYLRIKNSFKIFMNINVCKINEDVALLEIFMHVFHEFFISFHENLHEFIFIRTSTQSWDLPKLLRCLVRTWIICFCNSFLSWAGASLPFSCKRTVALTTACFPSNPIASSLEPTYVGDSDVSAREASN